MSTISAAWKIIPQFQALSTTSTIAFYTTELHFKLGGSHSSSPGEEPIFCSVFKGAKAAANIYFTKCDSEQDFHASTAWIAMGDEALDEFYEELKSAGRVRIVEEVADKAWGYRQFKILDCDGNQLVFFRFLEGGNGEGGENTQDGE